MTPRQAERLERIVRINVLADGTVTGAVFRSSAAWRDGQIEIHEMFMPSDRMQPEDVQACEAWVRSGRDNPVSASNGRPSNPAKGDE